MSSAMRMSAVSVSAVRMRHDYECGLHMWTNVRRIKTEQSCLLYVSPLRLRVNSSHMITHSYLFRTGER